MLEVPSTLILGFQNGKYSSFLNYIFKQLQTLILDSVADILPLALTVAGAILVVTLGWRLFRNFTRG